MTRNVLPQRRRAENFVLKNDAGLDAAVVTVGYYDDGQVGEIFINAPKVGSDIESTARDGAILISLGLQHNVPLALMRHALTREANGKPSTIIGAVLDKLVEHEEESWALSKT